MSDYSGNDITANHVGDNTINNVTHITQAVGDFQFPDFPNLVWTTYVGYDNRATIDVLSEEDKDVFEKLQLNAVWSKIFLSDFRIQFFPVESNFQKTKPNLTKDLKQIDIDKDEFIRLGLPLQLINEIDAIKAGFVKEIDSLQDWLDQSLSDFYTKVSQEIDPLKSRYSEYRREEENNRKDLDVSLEKLKSSLSNEFNDLASIRKDLDDFTRLKNLFVNIESRLSEKKDSEAKITEFKKTINWLAIPEVRIFQSKKQKLEKILEDAKKKISSIYVKIKNKKLEKDEINRSIIRNQESELEAKRLIMSIDAECKRLNWRIQELKVFFDSKLPGEDVADMLEICEKLEAGMLIDREALDKKKKQGSMIEAGVNSELKNTQIALKAKYGYPSFRSKQDENNYVKEYEYSKKIASGKIENIKWNLAKIENALKEKGIILEKVKDFNKTRDLLRKAGDEIISEKHKFLIIGKDKADLHEELDWIICEISVLSDEEKNVSKKIGEIEEDIAMIENGISLSCSMLEKKKKIEEDIAAEWRLIEGIQKDINYLDGMLRKFTHIPLKQIIVEGGKISTVIAGFNPWIDKTLKSISEYYRVRTLEITKSESFERIKKSIHEHRSVLMNTGEMISNVCNNAESLAKKFEKGHLELVDQAQKKTDEEILKVSKQLNDLRTKNEDLISIAKRVELEKLENERKKQDELNTLEQQRISEILKIAPYQGNAPLANLSEEEFRKLLKEVKNTRYKNLLASNFYRVQKLIGVVFGSLFWRIVLVVSLLIIWLSFSSDPVKETTLPNIPFLATLAWTVYPWCDSGDIVLSNWQVWSACNVWASESYTWWVAQPVTESSLKAGNWKRYIGEFFRGVTKSNQICTTWYRLPSRDDWARSIDVIKESWNSVGQILKLPLSGTQVGWRKVYKNQWMQGFYATSTPKGVSQSFVVYLTSTNIDPDYYGNDMAYWISVRCIRN